MQLLRPVDVAGSPRMEQVHPQATYRVRLHPGFGFDSVAAIADYVAALGVSHVYAPPSRQAAAGSTHGYDVVNLSRLTTSSAAPRATPPVLGAAPPRPRPAPRHRPPTTWPSAPAQPVVGRARERTGQRVRRTLRHRLGPPGSQTAGPRPRARPQGPLSPRAGGGRAGDGARDVNRLTELAVRVLDRHPHYRDYTPPGGPRGRRRAAGLPEPNRRRALPGRDGQGGDPAPARPRHELFDFLGHVLLGAGCRASSRPSSWCVPAGVGAGHGQKGRVTSSPSPARAACSPWRLGWSSAWPAGEGGETRC